MHRRTGTPTPTPRPRARFFVLEDDVSFADVDTAGLVAVAKLESDPVLDAATVLSRSAFADHHDEVRDGEGNAAVSLSVPVV
jgi:hypothetical protein